MLTPVEMRPRRPRMTEAEKAAALVSVRAAYEAGASIRQIATDWGRQPSWAWRMVHASGAQVRPVGQPPRGRRPGGEA